MLEFSLYVLLGSCVLMALVRLLGVGQTNWLLDSSDTTWRFITDMFAIFAFATVCIALSYFGPTWLKMLGVNLPGKLRHGPTVVLLLSVIAALGSLVCIFASSWQLNAEIKGHHTVKHLSLIVQVVVLLALGHLAYDVVQLGFRISFDWLPQTYKSFMVAAVAMTILVDYMLYLLFIEDKRIHDQSKN